MAEETVQDKVKGLMEHMRMLSDCREKMASLLAGLPKELPIETETVPEAFSIRGDTKTVVNLQRTLKARIDLIDEEMTRTKSGILRLDPKAYDATKKGSHAKTDG